MSYKPPRRPQFFYTTAPLPCPYLAGRTERKVVTEITGPDADALHDRLSRAGFRRSHNIAYAPVCPSCQACIPIRIPVATFQPGRTLHQHHRACRIPPRVCTLYKALNVQIFLSRLSGTAALLWQRWLGMKILR